MELAIVLHLDLVSTIRPVEFAVVLDLDFVEDGDIATDVIRVCGGSHLRS